MLAWLSANTGILSGILGLVVVVDHYLASSGWFKAGSTGQAIVNGIDTVVGWVLKLLPGSGQASPPAPPAA